MNMNVAELCSTIRRQFCDGLNVEQTKDGALVYLPFFDINGDAIEILITLHGQTAIIEDVGHVAGLLFQLGQHHPDNPGHLLTKSIAENFKIDMDYDQGILCKSISTDNFTQLFSFIQALVSIKTAIPQLKYRKRIRKQGKRLVSKMTKDIKQLQLPMGVQRQSEIQGKNEFWTVDFKYSTKKNGDNSDVYIVATDFKWGEPREKASYALTLAVDVLELNKHKDLRIVYDLGTNGNRVSSERAAALLKNHQYDVGYRVFNYGDIENKTELVTKINQELSLQLF